jgi:hypothetical protein
MRQPDAALTNKTAMSAAARDHASLRLVCLALLLALSALIWRIGTIW